MDLIYWSSLPGVPKKLKWPVKVSAFGQYTSVYCKSDDAYFRVKLEQLIPFPGEFEKLKQQGLVSLAKRPRDKIAFLDDVEWALKQVQNSRGKEPEQPTVSEEIEEERSVVPDRPGTPDSDSSKRRTQSPKKTSTPDPPSEGRERTLTLEVKEKSFSKEENSPESQGIDRQGSPILMRSLDDTGEKVTSQEGIVEVTTISPLSKFQEDMEDSRLSNECIGASADEKSDPSSQESMAPEPITEQIDLRDRTRKHQSEEDQLWSRRPQDPGSCLEEGEIHKQLAGRKIETEENDSKSETERRQVQGKQESPPHKVQPGKQSETSESESGEEAPKSKKHARSSSSESEPRRKITVSSKQGENVEVEPEKKALVNGRRHPSRSSSPDPPQWHRGQRSSSKSPVRHRRSSSPPVRTKRARSKSPRRKHSPSPVRSNKEQSRKSRSRSKEERRERLRREVVARRQVQGKQESPPHKVQPGKQSETSESESGEEAPKSKKHARSSSSESEPRRKITVSSKQGENVEVEPEKKALVNGRRHPSRSSSPDPPQWHRGQRSSSKSPVRHRRSSSPPVRTKRARSKSPRRKHSPSPVRSNKEQSRKSRSRSKEERRERLRREVVARRQVQGKQESPPHKVQPGKQSETSESESGEEAPKSKKHARSSSSESEPRRKITVSSKQGENVEVEPEKKALVNGRRHPSRSSSPDPPQWHRGQRSSSKSPVRHRRSSSPPVRTKRARSKSPRRKHSPSPVRSNKEQSRKSRSRSKEERRERLRREVVARRQVQGKQESPPHKVQPGKQSETSESESGEEAPKSKKHARSSSSESEPRRKITVSSKQGENVEVEPEKKALVNGRRHPSRSSSPDPPQWHRGQRSSSKSPVRHRRSSSPPVRTKRARSKSPRRKHSPSPVRSNKEQSRKSRSRSKEERRERLRREVVARRQVQGKQESPPHKVQPGKQSETSESESGEEAPKSKKHALSSSSESEPRRKITVSSKQGENVEVEPEKKALVNGRRHPSRSSSPDPPQWHRGQRSSSKSPVRHRRSSSPPVRTKRARSKSPRRKHSPSPVRSNKEQSRKSRSRSKEERRERLRREVVARRQVQGKQESPPHKVQPGKQSETSESESGEEAPKSKKHARSSSSESEPRRKITVSSKQGENVEVELEKMSLVNGRRHPSRSSSPDPPQWHRGQRSSSKSPVRHRRSSSSPVRTKRARSKSPTRKHSPSPVRSNKEQSRKSRSRSKEERRKQSSRSSRSAVTSAKDSKDEEDALDTDSCDDSFVDPNFVPNESDIESDIEDHASDFLDTEEYVCASESDSSDCIQYFPALTVEKTPADCRLKKDQAGISISSDSQTSGSFETLSDLHYQSNHEHDLLDEGDIERDKTYPDVFIRKMKQSKNDRRIYDNYHCCLVCKKMKSNIRKHILVHKENDTVKKIMRLQLKNEKTQQKEIERLKTILRNAGDNAHNQVVFERKKGELIVSRRPASFNLSDFGPCPNCFEWIKMGVCVTKHQKQCAGGIKDGQKLSKGQMVVRSNVLKGVLSLEASAGLLTHVYPIMTRDRITEIAQRDSLIVGLGNFSYRQSVNNKGKRKYITSSRMRGAARLLKSLREKHGMDMSMKDFLNVDYFESCVEAALSCASPDEVDTEDLKHPSAALKAGNDLFQMADIQIGIAVQDRDVGEKEELEGFIFLLKKNWRNRVARLANKLLRERKMLKKVQLPNPSDLQKLASYLKEKLSSKSYDTYRSAAEYSLCRLLLYNKRRSGELENTLKLSYHARSETLDESDEAVIGDLTPLEKRLLGSQEIMKIEGKGEQTVPVIIPTDAAHALEYIMDPAVRKDAGIKEDNPYLFATRGDGSMRAYETLKRVCTEVEVVAPDTLTSVNLRKYFATMTQVIGLKDHELGWLCKHLGHTTDVHKLHYRAASGYIERINIGKLMLLQDFNVASKFKGQSLEDIRVEDILETAERKDTGLGDIGEAEQEEAPDGQSLIVNSVSQSHRKNKKVVRQRWSLEEEEELNQLFEMNIRDCVCPSKQELRRAVSISREKSGKIHLRTLDNIKKKVWNMYKKYAK